MTPALNNPDVATFINVFTVEPSKQNALVDRIKDDAETIISRQAGFIRAIVHRSLDGSQVVNLVQWESVEASRAIHRNPDVVAGFASYQTLGLQMDLRYYKAASTLKQHLALQHSDHLMAHINVLHVVPDNQHLLLRQLAQHTTPMSDSQADHSIVWFQSLDGLRLICFSWHNNGENTAPSFMQVFAPQNWIEQANSNHYQVEFIVAAQVLR